MDAWDNTIDELTKTPENQKKVLERHVDNFSTRKLKTKRGEYSVDKYEENSAFFTP